MKILDVDSVVFLISRKPKIIHKSNNLLWSTPYFLTNIHEILTPEKSLHGMGGNKYNESK